MIKSFTSLRGIFILFIFFHHCLDLYPGGGTLAVAFFFILGGFGLTLGYKDRVMSSLFNIRQYFTKRVIKFYPLHLVCLLAALPLALPSFSVKQVLVLVINAALLQSWIPIKGVNFSFNGVSWYLADTMFFAVIFPFLLKWIINASPKGKVLIATAFAVIYAVVAIIIPTDIHHAILYISPYMRLTDFVFGIYLALGYLKFKEKPISFYSNNSLTQVLVFALIVLLVVESCVLSEDTVLFAPVYWPFLASLILIASLSEVVGGGRNYSGTNISNGLENLASRYFLYIS